MNVSGPCADPAVRRAIIQALDEKRLHDVWPEDGSALPVALAPRASAGIRRRIIGDGGRALRSLRERLGTLRLLYVANSTRQAQAASSSNGYSTMPAFHWNFGPCRTPVYFSSDGPLRRGAFDLRITAFSYPDPSPDL